MARMESGGIELRGEVGHSNRSGWHFFALHLGLREKSFFLSFFSTSRTFINFVVGIFTLLSL